MYESIMSYITYHGFHGQITVFYLGAVYISAKSKFVSTPQIARIAVTSFKLHESS